MSYDFKEEYECWVWARLGRYILIGLGCGILYFVVRWLWPMFFGGV